MVYYELMYFDNKHSWWSSELNRWLPLNSKKRAGCCSYRKLGTDGNKAWKIFRKEDVGAVLIKYTNKRSGFYVTEYEKTVKSYIKR